MLKLLGVKEVRCMDLALMVAQVCNFVRIWLAEAQNIDAGVLLIGACFA
jgi:hypothetical protein